MILNLLYFSIEKVWKMIFKNVWEPCLNAGNGCTTLGKELCLVL